MGAGAERWVEGLRGGDADVFDEVYAAYRARIFGYLVRLTQNRALAEDLLQETWLRVARSARRLAPDSRLEPWLFRIAHNLFISHRRWAALDMARLTALKSAPPAISAAASPFEASSATDLQRRLERALAGLSVAHREILSLVAIEGLEPAEAASVLGLSPAATRQRLKRARDALAATLEEEERPAPRASPPLAADGVNR